MNSRQVVALVGTLVFSNCAAVLAAGRAQDRHVRVDVEDAGSSGPPDFYAPEEALVSYINEALDKNPAVHEMLARYGAALERAPQVSTLPDPVFSFTQAIRTVETRVGPQLNSYVLSQALPWFGTLDLRGKVAMQEALSVFERYRATQQEIVVQVKRAFYDLAYVDAALEITREEQSLLEHYEELAQTRYATGQGLQHAVIKIQAEITRVCLFTINPPGKICARSEMRRQNEGRCLRDDAGFTRIADSRAGEVNGSPATRISGNVLRSFPPFVAMVKPAYLR